MTTVTKTESPDCMIVDSEHAAYRAYFVHTELKTSMNVLSGVFYGFLSIINTQIQRLNPKNIILVWGAENSGALRKQAYPHYKANRKPHDGLYYQIKNLQKFFSCLNWQQVFNNQGYEADDVIATLAHDNDHKGLKTVILSGDHDFHQLVTDHVSCIVPGTSKKPDTYFTPTTVLAHYGVPVDQLSDYFSLIGEDSDNIVGVPQIGEKTAQQILQKNGPIKSWFNSIDTIQARPRHKDLLKEHKERIAINKKLISLKTTNIPIMQIPRVTDTETAKKILDYYEIKKFSLQDFSQFCSSSVVVPE